jgi:APA family basic amino acid/polyamine antiporter
LSQAADSEKGLKRTLGSGNLIALGIGAIIGAGLFVRTAAAAGGHAGSAVYIIFYRSSYRLCFCRPLLC